MFFVALPSAPLSLRFHAHPAVSPSFSAVVDHLVSPAGGEVRVPVAIFAPVQTLHMARPPMEGEDRLDPSSWLLMVTADSSGVIKVFENKRVPSTAAASATARRQ